MMAQFDAPDMEKNKRDREEYQENARRLKAELVKSNIYLGNDDNWS